MADNVIRLWHLPPEIIQLIAFYANTNYANDKLVPMSPSLYAFFDTLPADTRGTYGVQYVLEKLHPGVIDIDLEGETNDSMRKRFDATSRRHWWKLWFQNYAVSFNLREKRVPDGILRLKDTAHVKLCFQKALYNVMKSTDIRTKKTTRSFDVRWSALMSMSRICKIDELQVARLVMQDIYFDGTGDYMSDDRAQIIVEALRFLLHRYKQVKHHLRTTIFPMSNGFECYCSLFYHPLKQDTSRTFMTLIKNTYDIRSLLDFVELTQMKTYADYISAVHFTVLLEDLYPDEKPDAATDDFLVVAREMSKQATMRIFRMLDGPCRLSRALIHAKPSLLRDAFQWDGVFPPFYGIDEEAPDTDIERYIRNEVVAPILLLDTSYTDARLADVIRFIVVNDDNLPYIKYAHMGIRAVVDRITDPSVKQHLCCDLVAALDNIVHNIAEYTHGFMAWCGGMARDDVIIQTICRNNNMHPQSIVWDPDGRRGINFERSEHGDLLRRHLLMVYVKHIYETHNLVLYLCSLKE